ncbi:hypothetical protein [Tellurirhabdus bombi]|uniref:hypothetical protein n=1 Tax=Tellurirhabdus bombi TaxID=2907205 RepID=UPI001F2ACB80|nr:hypothetical protein [Tellurirhabdus bombi]
MDPSKNPNLHPLSAVPSGMDHDPKADEEIIDQTRPDDQTNKDETELKPSEPVGRIPSQTADDPTQDTDLSTKIAYALDGTEFSPAEAEPGHKTKTEGITGASLAEEEANLKR